MEIYVLIVLGIALVCWITVLCQADSCLAAATQLVLVIATILALVFQCMNMIDNEYDEAACQQIDLPNDG